MNTSNNILTSKEQPKWIHPWNIEKFDSIETRDERFFSLVIKGVLRWLTQNILMYNKPIKHFIFNTGSSYLYIETNGYEFSWNETTGEDMMYMERPRCVVELNDITINNEELTQPHIRGAYERRIDENGNYAGFNAELRRIPITLSLNLTYVMSNFNESIILVQELMDKLLFQKYFNIVYLGQNIQCSVEFPNNFRIELNKIDLSSAEPNNRILGMQLNVCTNYPSIDERTEISSSKVIGSFASNINVFKDDAKNITDKEKFIVD